MNNLSLYNQYGIDFLPVVVASLKNRNAGELVLRDFLSAAWSDLEAREEHASCRRARAVSAVLPRHVTITIRRYYDLVARSLRALRQSLVALESYIDKTSEKYLDVSLRQYETAARFNMAEVRMRMDFSPLVCDRLSAA